MPTDRSASPVLRLGLPVDRQEALALAVPLGAFLSQRLLRLGRGALGLGPRAL
jgi:hypothetical protein